VNLARLRVTKVRRFQEPRTADFGKFGVEEGCSAPLCIAHEKLEIDQRKIRWLKRDYNMPTGF
jgi:hypothetical protein